MKVVQVVCSDRFAGVERHVSVLAWELDRLGADVTVIGGESAAMRSAFEGSGVRHVPAASSRAAARALTGIGRVDIVNSHMTDADVVAARRVRRLGARHISTRHFAAVRGSRPLLRPALRWALRDLAAQIAVSHVVAEAVEGDAEVVHPGVAEAPPGAHDQRWVLVAQRLEREKDTAAALAAWQRTRARREGWRLRIAGDGAERERLEALATDLGIADTVDFLGFRTDVHELMARAGLLLASPPDEHLGLSVLEAMARATPVVATASGGHLETAGGVDTMALYPAGDAEAAARTIDGLIADAPRRAALGAQLRRRQHEAFTAAASAAATLAVYTRVLGG